MEITIQTKALSVNECWQGRRFKTKKYEAYEKEVAALLPRKETIFGPKKVSLTFYLKELFRGDVDNLIKPVLDIIVKRGYIEDDRWIMELIVKKVKGNSKIEIKIEKYAL